MLRRSTFTSSRDLLRTRWVSKLTGLKPGAYAIRWQVLAPDGHISRGEIPFVCQESLMLTDLLGLFGFVVVLLRAAILCFQTIAVGGIIFLLVVARAGAIRPGTVEPFRAMQLIRWSALALALAEVYIRRQ